MFKGIDWVAVGCAIVFASMLGAILDDAKRKRQARRAEHGWLDEAFRDVLVKVEMEDLDDEYRRLVESA